MEKCQILFLNAGVKRSKSHKELQFFSSLVSRGVVHLPNRPHRAQVVNLEEARKSFAQRISQRETIDVDEGDDE